MLNILCLSFILANSLFIALNVKLQNYVEEYKKYVSKTRKKLHFPSWVDNSLFSVQ